MAEGHRLRHLQVGEAGHHRVGMLRRPARPVRAAAPRSSATMRSISPRSHSRRSVATWSLRERPGVQPLAGVADQLGQPRLDVQVHVFELELPLEVAALDLAADLRQPALDRGQVIRAR